MVPSAYALWVPVYLAGLVSLAVLPFERIAHNPLGGTAALTGLAVLYTLWLPVALVLQLGLAIAALVSMRRVARGTVGRARLVVLGWAGVAQPLLQAALAWLLTAARIDALLAHGAGPACSARSSTSCRPTYRSST